MLDGLEQMKKMASKPRSMYTLLLLCSKGEKKVCKHFFYDIHNYLCGNVLLTRTKFSDNHEIAKIR